MAASLSSSSASLFAIAMIFAIGRLVSAVGEMADDRLLRVRVERAVVKSDQRGGGRARGLRGRGGRLQREQCRRSDGQSCDCLPDRRCRPDGLHYFLSRMSSKNLTARGSCDWPSQNIACLRTSGLRFVARDLHQLRHALVLRQLAEREHRLLLHLGVRVVVDGAGDDGDRFLAGLLRQPEERLAADLRAAVVARGGDRASSTPPAPC